eukprot:TRINITY_DN3619_c1_g1_i1.p1 TRINITY_DN3619_c1_g1~~TRINITY_DN3619_c1_g1_i1.p1  ORF type:complete len:203 (+),score=47.56 TRINITY_DN3619_c1_g1_i1:36-644(+)
MEGSVPDDDDSSTQKPIEAFLDRKGGLFKTWQKNKWFVFDPDQQMVRWYRGPEVAKSLGRIDVFRCTVNVPSKAKKGEFPFEVVTRGQKKFLLRAPAESVRREWIDGILKMNTDIESIIADYQKQDGSASALALCVADFLEGSQEDTSNDREKDKDEDDDEDDDKIDLLSLHIQNLKGESLPLAGVFNRHPIIMLALLRHFG